MQNLTTQEAAKYLTLAGFRISPRGLQARRKNGKQPDFLKIERRVYYTPDALDGLLATGRKPK